MKNRILVVEDEEDIANLVKMNLEIAGYEVVWAGDGVLAEQLILGEEGNFDLALLDLMLPGKDGFSLIEPMKKRGIPVICLTAKGDVFSKVQGLKLGAEDYMVKPFEILELLVRIEKVLERTGKQKNELSFGDLLVDLRAQKVWEKGVLVDLKPMEYRLLVVFLQNRNMVLKRDQLLNLVWGEQFFGETRTVDVHVARLRKKLESCRAIETVPKGGYLFADGE